MYKKRGQDGEAMDKIIPYNPIFECNKPDNCWRTLSSNKPIRMNVSTYTLSRYRIRNPIVCPIASRIHRIERIHASSKNFIIFVEMELI